MNFRPDVPPHAPSQENVSDVSKQNRFQLLPSEETLSLAKERMRRVLEKPGYFSMSHEECVTYFGSGDFAIAPELKQGNFGDCYLVSSLYALSQSSFFEVMVRSGVERSEDGSWKVRMPLLHKELDSIIVLPEDIAMHKNEKFLKRHKVGRLLPDLRKTLKPVRAGEGYLALEAAWIKHKFGRVNRLSAEGGNEGEVLQLLGGDFMEIAEFFPEYPDPDVKGWWPTLEDLPETERASLDIILENFDSDIHAATLSTKALRGMPFIRRNFGRLTGGTMYRGKGSLRPFFTNHSYAVKSVNRDNKTITIVNPWNTAKPVVMTFDQMKGTFSEFCLACFDSNKLIAATDEARKKYQM